MPETFVLYEHEPMHISVDEGNPRTIYNNSEKPISWAHSLDEMPHGTIGPKSSGTFLRSVYIVSDETVRTIAVLP